MHRFHLWSLSLLLITFLSANAQEQKPQSSLSDLPVEAQNRISGVLGRDLPAYSAMQDGSAINISNPRQHLTARFDNECVRFRDGNASWAISVESFSYGDAVQTLPRVLPTSQHNKIQYERGKLIEWYVNGPAGIEQGFTVTNRVAHPEGTALKVTLKISGTLIASLDSSKRGLHLSDPQNVAHLQYASLSAYDSAGMSLPASLELQGNKLSLSVLDSGAQYPVVIDPTIKQFKLLDSNPANGDALGYASAISGNTVVVGAPGAFNGTIESGAAFVFVKPSTGWANITESAKLIPSDGADGDEFGSSVAISGNNIAVGAPDHPSSTRVGKGYFYTRPSTTGWSGTITEFGALGTGSTNAATFGASIAMSGQYVLVGSPGENTAYLIGCAANNGSCALDAKFVGGSGSSSAFGTAVAMNGFNLAVTDPYATVGSNQFQGVAYAYNYLGHNQWSRVTLTSSDGGFLDEMGISVAMSSNTIVVGCPFCGLGRIPTAGAAYVYTKPTNGWMDSTQSAKLTSSDGIAGDGLGTSVAVSGGIIVAGAPTKNVGNNATQGEAYVYIQSAGVWHDTTENIRLIASDGQKFDTFGQSVGVSGVTAIVGANGGKNGNLNLVTGSEYLFMQ